MKLEKKHWISIAVIVIALILVWYFFMRKKPAAASIIYPSDSSENNYTPLSISCKNKCELTYHGKVNHYCNQFSGQKKQDCLNKALSDFNTCKSNCSKMQ